MQDLTTGSVTRHLLKSTSFMLVTMVSQTLYVLVDLYWVGRLGKEAVAGVGVAGNLLFIVLAISQMLGVGAMVFISHAAGRKDHGRALLVFNQAQVLSLFVAVLFFAISMLVREPYANALAADAATARLAKDYLGWFLPAMALQFGIVAMGASLRGIGDFKPGMIVQTGTVVINMVLAPFLIFGWVTHHAMGVAGAALASFIALVIGSFWMLAFFLRPRGFLRFVLADWKPRPDLWLGMLKVGLPAGAEFALMAVYLFVIYALSRPFGAAAQAGFGIGTRVTQAGFLPVVALGFAAGPVAGQNVGARLGARVVETFRAALLLSASLMVPFTILCHLAPGAMVRVFSSDPQVVAVGDEYLRIISWNFVASGVIFVSSSMFQALGNTVPSLLASLSRIVLLAIPAVMLARLPGFQLRWLWYLSVGSVTFQMVASLALLRREFGRRLPAEAQAPAPAVAPVPAPVPVSND